MQKNIVHAVMMAGLMAVPISAMAQHYPVGLEGIKGASLPPPGLYLRDYNVGYYATHFPGGAPDFKASVYINAPRLIYMTEYKILGATYGMDIVVPFGYKHMSFTTPVGKYDKSSFGLYDIQVEPLLLGWHFKKLDVGAGYAIWAPAGEFSPNRPDHLGSGYWGHMFTLGATYFFDEEKTWAMSALNRYEINHEQDKTKVTPGQTLTVEWGLSKSFQKVYDAGLIGYWQQQITTSQGPGGADKPGVVGIGPEFSMAIPSVTTFVSVRYAREFAAHDRPEGNTFTLTLTKRF